MYDLSVEGQNRGVTEKVINKKIGKKKVDKNKW